jgi:hypothetical protein
MPDTLKSGGGVLHARVGELPAEIIQNFYEIVQGETKTLTFIVVAVGRFEVAECDAIVCKFADTTNNVVVIEEDDYGNIQRVCQELDIQVIRCTLSSEQTASLTPGMLRAEISFDQQKAALHYTLKMIEQIDP